MNTPRKTSARISAAQPDDDVLLQRIGKDRDHAAFEELFRRHTDHAFNLAFHITRNAQRAEDAVQEAFLAVWTHAEKYRPGNAKAWILGIVAKKGMHMNRQKDEHAAMIEERLQPPDSHEETTDRVGKNELLNALRELIWKLPQRERAMVALHYGAGMTQGEVARELGMPARTLSARLASVHSELREKLSAAGLGAALPLLNERGLNAALTTGCSVPAGLAARVARSVLSEAGRQSVRTAAASSLALTVYCAMAAIIVLGGGAVLYMASQQVTPTEISQAPAATAARKKQSAPVAAPLEHAPVNVNYSFDKGIPDGIKIIRGTCEGWIPPRGKRKGALLTTVSTTDGVAFVLPPCVLSNLVKVRLKAFVPEDEYLKRGLLDYSASLNVTWLMPLNRVNVHEKVVTWQSTTFEMVPAKTAYTFTYYLVGDYSVAYLGECLAALTKLPIPRNPDLPLVFCIGGLAVESIAIREIEAKDLPEECRDPEALIESAKTHPDQWSPCRFKLFTFQVNDEPVRLETPERLEDQKAAP